MSVPPSRDAGVVFPDAARGSRSGILLTGPGPLYGRAVPATPHAPRSVPPPGPPPLRRATAADAAALAHGVVDGLEDYPAFAPAGWAPPDLGEEESHTRDLLADPAVVCLVAEADGEIVGQITVLPATHGARPVNDPTLAHVRNLFVRRDHRGTGLASTLNAAAVEAARHDGFAALRLFVAAGQARARAFYEREGWVPASAPFHDPVPGLTMMEYRLVLDGRPD
jgi:GNAT superfamily N-acetyltransferase